MFGRPHLMSQSTNATAGIFVGFENSRKVMRRTLARFFPPTKRVLSTDQLKMMFFVLAILTLKIIYALNYRIDSDEPQHLHTVWAWANGMIPYRDVFDNHTPLFQLLCAPLLLAFGERPDIVIPMRLAMIPLYLVDLWLIYLIVKALYSERWAQWAISLAGIFPPFFLLTTEFRTDDLWTTLWLAVLFVGLCRPATPRWAAICGLLVGACFATSMKTALLVFAVAVALSVIFLGGAARTKRLEWSGWLRRAGAFTGAALIVPGAFCLFFASRGSWPQLYYGVIRHNLVPDLVETGFVPHAGRPFYFPVVLAILLAATIAVYLRPGPSPLRTKRLLTVLIPAFYLAGLWSYWPVFYGEHYAPFYPMLFIGLIPLAGMVGFPSGRFGWTGQRAVLVIAMVAAVELAWLFVWQPAWQNRNARHIKLVADVLRLTGEHDFVMDGKCETIFRPRPFYYVLETMTDARVERGTIRDDIPERLIDTRTAVARTVRLYPRSLAFVEQNYLHVTDDLLVLGRKLKREPGLAGREFSFQIIVPNRYTIVSSSGAAMGDLDGVPLQGGRWLEAGEHRFVCSGSETALAVVWAKAVELGYWPLDMVPGSSRHHDDIAAR